MKRLLPAIGIGLLAFAFRLLSSADLSNDHYMHMAWAQQLLFGQLPGRDFVDPGMPLVYAISALAQWMRPGPFTELFLSASLMGLAAAITYIAATRLAGSPVVGAAVTLLEIGFQSRFYSYPKILVPAVALLLFQVYTQRPSRRRLIVLGIWTGIAGLLRHDLALYTAFGMAAGLIAFHSTDRRQLVRRLGLYAAAAALTLAPYALFVLQTEGIAEHLRRGLEFAKAESHQRIFILPSLSSVQVLPWTHDVAAAVLFYGAHVLVLAAIAVIVVRRSTLSHARLAWAVTATATLTAYLAVILRYPLDARLPDMASVMALVLAWVFGQAVQPGTTSDGQLTANDGGLGSRPRRPARWAGAVAAALAFLILAHGVWVLGKVSEAIDNTGISGGWRDVVETYTDLDERGTVWPWARSWPNRELPAVVRYLNECTAPTDAVMLTWPAPEYAFFARRRFAAGHAEFLPPRAFTTDRDQEQMLTWLRGQRVPVVLVNESRREEFAAAFPKIDAYIRTGYAAAGHFTIYDDSAITLAVRNGLSGSRTWGEEGWPCGF